MEKKRAFGILGILVVIFAICILLTNGKNQKSKQSTIKQVNQERVTKEAGISWKTEKTLQVQEGDYTFCAHPSEDGSYSWIYEIKVAKKGTRQTLNIPSKIEGKDVAKIGADMSEEVDMEFYKNVFGEYVESCHNADGENEYITKIPAITFPDTVEEIENSAFSGLESIDSVILPESLKKLGGDAFYSCDSVSRVYIPKYCEGDFGNAFFEDCNSIKTIEVSEKKGQSFFSWDCHHVMY